MNRPSRIVVVLAIGASSAACGLVIGINDIYPAPASEITGADGATDGASDGSSFDAKQPDGAACGADLDGDEKNCGRCGHDCMGGACSGGHCQPVALTSSEVDLEELRATTDRVLYRAQNQVRAVGIDGGLPAILVPCAIRPGLALSDSAYYSWCAGVVTARDLVDSGVVAGGAIDGRGGVVAGGWLVYFEANTYIRRVPATLGDAGPSDITTAIGGYRSVAATSSQVFFMSNAGSLSYTAPGSGTGTELEPNQTGPSEIAVDDGAVFWATDSDTDQAILHSRALSGGTASVIATGLDHPDGIAIDEANVYVTARGTPPSYTNGSILRVPRAGGAVEHLVDGVLDPHEIVLRDGFVLYTSRGTMADGGGYVGGTIYRLAK